MDVVNSLIDRGVQSQDIINCSEVGEYISCKFLEGCLINSKPALTFCCGDYGKNKSPVVHEGETYEETMRSFFSTRDRIIEALNNPTEKNNICTAQCAGCCELKKCAWDADRYIRNLNFSYSRTCNFHCLYCKIDQEKDKNLLCSDAESALEFFHFLEDHQYINKDTLISIGSGEISIHPLSNKILEALQDYACIFFSNAGIYNEKLAEILSKKRSRLVVSIDAGTRETFAKIKGLDLYDKVCENSCRYARDGMVNLKYIYMPGINDSEDDIMGFIALCEREKFNEFIVSRNYHDMSPLSESSISSIARMVHEAQRIGLHVSIPDEMFTGSDDKNRILKRLRKMC